jgi:hypothetical protein
MKSHCRRACVGWYRTESGTWLLLLLPPYVGGVGGGVCALVFVELSVRAVVRASRVPSQESGHIYDRFGAHS